MTTSAYLYEGPIFYFYLPPLYKSHGDVHLSFFNTFFPFGKHYVLEKDLDIYIHSDVGFHKVLLLTLPFAEGSRGCHALLWLDAQNLNAKERHFILPLVIWTFIMQFVAFISPCHKIV